MQRSLDEFLAASAAGDDVSKAVARAVSAIAEASAALQAEIAKGSSWRVKAASGTNAGGDVQQELDVIADRLYLDAAKRAGVAAYASEEQDEPFAIDAAGRVALAIDPLDGSSNIDTNVPIGTIFSLMPVASGSDPARAFFQAGRAQVAAGFVIYGPRTALALTLGHGTSIFIYDHATRRYLEIADKVQIPREKNEYAINASNYRFWDDAVRAFVDDCIAGADGPIAADFNTRWIASLVAEAYRILGRGGVFLYPGDIRKGYRLGRLRLIYEANPIAFIAEQAGGGATTGDRRILDIVPESLHQRTPLVFGSSDHVERIQRYFRDPGSIADRMPLFGRRGLLRA
ncbi:MAG: class 1 fructose-bisphosphatase [Bauldia sp.]